MAKNEKTFNEQNMRKIIRILSGLSASQQQLAEQCINEYDPTRTYQKDNICFFNGSLYRAKTVTNGNEPSPESTYFEMLDGVEEEIDAQYIETLMSTVSAETFDYMKNFINDDIISGSHGFSSAKIYSEIQNAIQTAKDYTLEQVANSSTGSYVIVTGTDEIVDDKHLFLIANSSGYDIYALVNGAPTKIGNTSVNLNGLLTEANAETTYLKQADATATYATITTTDGLRTDLDNHTGDTDIHVTKELKDKLVTTDDLGGYAKTTDLPTIPNIATAINASSVDTDTVSPKAVYDNAIKDKNLKTYTYLEQIGLRKPTTVGDIFNALPILSSINIQVDNFSITDAPYGNGILMIDKYINSKFSILFKISGGGSVADNGLYIGQLKGSDGTGLTWERVCTTKVENKSWATIKESTFTNTTFVHGGNCSYSISNGIAYIRFNGLTTVSASTITAPEGTFPILDSSLTNGHYPVVTSGGNTALCIITPGGGLRINLTSSIGDIYTTISYPVAES